MIVEFIDRVSQDMVVGFFFKGHDLARIADREYQLAAERLGAPVQYGGRPVGAVHKHLGINKGHLRRRLAILKYVLQSHGVDEAIIRRWLDHERGLESEITNARECVE